MNRKLIITAITGFNIALSFALVSNFLPIYLDSVGVSLINIGLIFAFGAMLAGILRFPVGTIADRVGRKPLMIFGAIGYPLFALGVILSRNTVHFIGIKLLIELFGALFWTAFWTYIYDMLTRGKEGRQLSGIYILTGASNVLAPILGGVIITMYGFTHLFYLAAAIGLVNILFITFVIKEYHAKGKSETLREFEHDIAKEYHHIVNIKKFRNIMTIGVLHNVVWCIWYVYMPIYLYSNGMAFKNIGLLLAFMQLTSMVMNYPIGKMVDKFPSKYLIIPGFFLVWLSGYFFLVFKDFTKLAIARATMGVGYNFTWMPLGARLSHLTPKKEHGATTGLFRAGCAITVGITTIFAGYLAEIYGIKIVLWGASTFAGIVSIFLLFIRDGIMGKGRSLLHKHHVINIHSSKPHQDKTHH